jgi:cysteine synthase A
MALDGGLAKRLRMIEVLVGNTPLLEIHCRYRGRHRIVYAKAEHLNLSGSIKDRMALHILRRAYEKGLLKPGDQIAEATSGNTGIALASIGRALGHPVTIFMPDWMSRERVALIQSLGAKIVAVSHEQGGFLGSIRMAEALADGRPNVFLPRQFSNEANTEAHQQTTGPEIGRQLQDCGRTADAFIAGVGTGGTIMGVGRYLREKNPKTRLHPLEPSQSPTLSTGCKMGNHRIQGISDEFIPPIVKLDELDHVVSMDDGDSILMAQKLAMQLGLGVGISSGANFLGALAIQNELGDDAVVATVFADDNKKYLSTPLFGDEPVKEGFATPDVELLGYETIGRVCSACDHPIGLTGH